MPRIESGKRQVKPVDGELPSPITPPKRCHFHPRCPFARDRCHMEVPVKKELSPGHLSAGHLNDEGSQTTGARTAICRA
ncbi:oligopeptide/dipeptide ABC transporter ATP-binding protein, partial [Rhizobium ruizarguesonis]